MDHSWGPKINKESLLSLLWLIKIGVLFLMKTWVECLVESIFKRMQNHSYTMLLPSIVLVAWFPVSFFIDLYLIDRYGLLAIWWCVVDIYTTYIFATILQLFFKKWRQNSERLA